MKAMPVMQSRLIWRRPLNEFHMKSPSVRYEDTACRRAHRVSSDSLYRPKKTGAGCHGHFWGIFLLHGRHQSSAFTASLHRSHGRCMLLQYDDEPCKRICPFTRHRLLQERQGAMSISTESQGRIEAS